MDRKAKVMGWGKSDTGKRKAQHSRRPGTTVSTGAESCRANQKTASDTCPEVPQ